MEKCSLFKDSLSPFRVYKVQREMLGSFLPCDCEVLSSSILPPVCSAALPKAYCFRPLFAPHSSGVLHGTLQAYRRTLCSAAI